jgi:4-hydroxy-tetrahydrodipicolinate synthase
MIRRPASEKPRREATFDRGSWGGIFPAICTPFTADGAVDVAGARAVARFAVDHGAHGLVCFGLAGEVPKLLRGEAL